jgi:hypothetical protein
VPRADQNDHHVDLDALSVLLDQIEQGDVVHIDPLVILGAPAVSLDPETAAAAAITDEPVVPVARTSAIGLYGIITQTCDVARGLEEEPFLHVSPLISVSAGDWETSREGRYSVRRFSYPGVIDGHEHLVLDVRVVQTIEKTALLDGSVKPVESVMTMPLKMTLARWLGARFARYAFPDELEEHVLSHLRGSIRDKHNASSPTGGLLRSIEGVWIQHTDSPMVTVLFILNVGRASADAQLQGDEGKILAGTETLMKALAKRLAKGDSGYQLHTEVRTPQQVTAFELLYDYHPLDISL